MTSLGFNTKCITPRTIQITLQAHEGKTDKTGVPYAEHIMHVMAAGRTTDEKVVGVQHDLVEDTDWIFEDMQRADYPTRIIDALRCVTKLSEKESYEDFMERVKTNPLPTDVEIIDLSDNLDIRKLKKLTDANVKRLRKYLKAYQSLISL